MMGIAAADGGGITGAIVNIAANTTRKDILAVVTRRIVVTQVKRAPLPRTQTAADVWLQDQAEKLVDLAPGLFNSLVIVERQAR